MSKGRKRWVSQVKQREQIHPSSDSFYPGFQWIEWRPPPPLPIGADNLLYSVYIFQCWSLPEILSQIYTQIMFYQLTGHPLAWSSWHIKLTWQFSYIVMKRIRGLFVFNYHKWQEGERGLWVWLAGKYRLFEDQGLGQLSFGDDMSWRGGKSLS